MKILILSQYWWPENGVPQRRWTWLSKVLIDAGHDVTVIAPPPHYRRKMTLRDWWERRRNRPIAGSSPDKGPVGECVVRSGFFPAGPSLTQRVFNQATVALGSIWASLRKPGHLKDFEPDLVIGTVPALPTAAATYVAAKSFGAPYIIDLRDAWPDLLDQSEKWNEGTGKISLREKILRKGPLQVVKQITKSVLNASLRSASAIIATSSDLAEDLIRRLERQSWTQAPIVVTIRNVFPVETRFEKKPRIKGPRDELNILYAGTLGRAQDLGNALEAAKLAEQKGVKIRLRFIGAGVTKPALQEFAKTQSLDVTFENQRPAGELGELYDWADSALVHLADWKPLSMAVPSKTYELMANRIHISGVLAGEAAEIIRQSGAGDVVAPGQPEALAVMWVELAKERSRLEVGTNAADWVERERSQNSPQTLLSIIEKATGSTS